MFTAFHSQTRVWFVSVRIGVRKGVRDKYLVNGIMELKGSNKFLNYRVGVSPLFCFLFQA